MTRFLLKNKFKSKHPSTPNLSIYVLLLTVSLCREQGSGLEIPNFTIPGRVPFRACTAWSRVKFLITQLFTLINLSPKHKDFKTQYRKNNYGKYLE